MRIRRNDCHDKYTLCIVTRRGSVDCSTGMSIKLNEFVVKRGSCPCLHGSITSLSLAGVVPVDCCTSQQSNEVPRDVTKRRSPCNVGLQNAGYRDVCLTPSTRHRNGLTATYGSPE